MDVFLHMLCMKLLMSLAKLKHLLKQLINIRAAETRVLATQP